LTRQSIPRPYVQKVKRMDALKRYIPALFVIGLLVVLLFFLVKILLPLLLVALVVGALVYRIKGPDKRHHAVRRPR